MKGPLICKALIVQPFFIRNPMLDHIWQGGFVGDSTAQSKEGGVCLLETDPLWFAWSAQRKTENLVLMRGAELASPSVLAACSPPEVLAGLCSVHGAETYSAHSTMVSTHLGAHENEQQMEVLPLFPRSQQWETGQGGWIWGPPATWAHPDPGSSLPLIVTRSCQFARQSHFPSHISADSYNNSPNLLAPKSSFVEDNFSMDQGWRWFWEDSSALNLLCILFLLLLHKPHLRSSGTRSQRLGTSA